jgi:hypothetical protein
LIYRRAYRVIYRVEKARVAILTVRNCAEEFDEAEIRRREVSQRAGSGTRSE